MNDLLANFMWRDLLFAGLGAGLFPLVCWAVSAITGSSRPVIPTGETSGEDAKAISNTSPREEHEPRMAAQDQLEAIEGIGPQIAEHLRARGIDTFEKLAAMTPQMLRAELLNRFELAQPSSWPVQAKLLSESNYEAFLKLAIALVAGVPRLVDIDGIGNAYAERLKLASQPIATVEALSQASPAVVSERCAVSEEEATRWVEHAQRLHDGDLDALLRMADLDRLAVLLSVVPFLDHKPAKPIAQQDRPISAPERERDGSMGARAGSLSASLADSLPRRLLRERRLCAPLLGAGAVGSVLLLACLEVIDLTPPCFPPKDTINVIPSPSKECKLSSRLQSDSLFISGSAILSDEGRKKLAELAMSLPPPSKSVGLPGAIVVVGHADRMRYGKPGGNDLLAQLRAHAVRDELQAKLNAWPDRLIFAFGRGDAVPTAATADCKPSASIEEFRNCLSFDRRVEVTAFYAEETAPISSNDPMSVTSKP